MAKRSLFRLKWSNFLTLAPSRITPVLSKEVLPGDIWHINCEAFLRLMPQLSPMYAHIYCLVHFWYIPNRLIWKSWERFITGGKSNDSSTADPTPVYPYITFNGTGPGTTGRSSMLSSVYDFLGYPARQSTSQTTPTLFSYGTYGFSALPLRAYCLTINTWYMNQEFDKPITLSTEDGLDVLTYTYIEDDGKRYFWNYPIASLWSRDYFTSALPSTQRGPMMTVPVKLPSVPPVPTPGDYIAKVAEKPLNLTVQNSSTFTGTPDQIDSTKTISYTPTGNVEIELTPSLSGEFAGKAATLSGKVDVSVSSVFTGKTTEYRVATPDPIRIGIGPSASEGVLNFTYSDLIPLEPHAIIGGTNNLLVYNVPNNAFFPINLDQTYYDESETRLIPHRFGTEGMWEPDTAASFYSFDYRDYGYINTTQCDVFNTKSPNLPTKYQLGQDEYLNEGYAHTIALANFQYPKATKIAIEPGSSAINANLGVTLRKTQALFNFIDNVVLPRGSYFDGTLVPLGTVVSTATGGTLSVNYTPEGTVKISGNVTGTGKFLGNNTTFETGKKTDYTPKGTVASSVGVTGTNQAQDAPILEKNVDISKIEEPTADSTGTFTIADLRLATQLQIWAERTMRTGYRYVESILAHFGVRVKDYRVQMPEFLGGFKFPISFSEVIQTSPQASVSSTPLGTMGGHGIGAGNRRIKMKSHEHGWLLALASVRSHSVYQDGVHRSLIRSTKFDYFWREFSHLTEQQIYNSEIYCAGTQETSAPTNYNTGIFGYQERYAEYKTAMNEVHGQFKGNLSYWHSGRIFADSISQDNTPKLNTTFVTMLPSFMQRTFAVTYSEQGSYILGHFHFDIRALRPIPKHARPSGLDHTYGGY
jgi:hypothetical protein